MLTENMTNDDILLPDESEDSESLDWLLEEDFEEQGDTLFALSEDTFDSTLSESDLLMANRPMARGDTEADSLETFVEEEIVLGSVGESSDIYNNGSDVQSTLVDVQHEATYEAVAIAHGQSSSTSLQQDNGFGIDDGSDFLGLTDDDDMGEKPLVLQRLGARPELPSSTMREDPLVEDEPAQLAGAEESTTLKEGDFVIEELMSDAVEDLVLHDDFCHEIEEPEFDLELETTIQRQESEEPLASLKEATEIQSIQTVEELELDALSDSATIEMRVDDHLSDVLPSSSQSVAELLTPVIELSASVDSAQDAFDLGSFEDGDLLDGGHESDASNHIEGVCLEDINEVDIESLGVERVEGVAPLDPSPFDEIDYHEDFDQFEMDTVGVVSVPAISEILAPLMTSITNSIVSRLNSLQEPPESVQAELVVVADAADVEARQTDGYVPLESLGIELPADLNRLGRLEIEAIWVRLVRLATGQYCNNLFLNPADTAGDDEALAESQREESANEYALFLDDEELDEDFFAESNSLPDIVNRQNVIDDVDLEDFPISDSANDQDFDEAIDFSDLAVVTETLYTASNDNELLDAGPIAALQDGVEDIFGSNLDHEFDEELRVEDGDEEELFASLSMGESALDDICGIAPDAFEDAGSSFDTVSDLLVRDGSDERQNVIGVVTKESQNNSWCIPENISFSVASQDGSEILCEFLDTFVEETAGELEKLEEAFAGWEQSFDTRVLPDSVLRILHTIKGIAKGVGLQCYGTLIHNFETLLEQVEIPAKGAQDPYFRIVNVWLNAAVQGFEHVAGSRADIQSALPAQAVDAFAQLSDSATVQAPTLVVTENVAAGQPFSTGPEGRQEPENPTKPDVVPDSSVKPLADQQSIRMTADAVDHLMNLTNQAQQLGVRSSQSAVRSKLATSELYARLSSVRTNVNQIADKALLNVTAKGGVQNSKLDALEMDQYSEIQEAANILREGVEDISELIAQTNRQNSMVEALLKQQASVISSLRGSIQATRVIPVSRLMPSLRRIIRTVSADLGKAVTFRVLQEIGSLDRDSHGRCQTILEHMVRNALDHGIESAEQRVIAGKPANGQITIDVRKEGSDYVISLSDDGRGMDPEALREAAFKRGLDVDVDALTDEDALKLIFHRGFSTATTLSEVSGRGVGMDVVMAEVQQLGGSIDISSELGRGTTFSIRVPSNLTVNGALLVTAAEESYAIPLDGLIAVEHVPVEDFFEAVSKRSTLSLFGLNCEPTYLASLCSGKNLPERNTWGATVPVIVAGNDRRTMAIAIDDVKQALELVIRSLGSQFASVPGLAGGATTADGQAIVALDLNSLVESIGDESQSAISDTSEARERMLVAVVDDSRTQRMVATSQFDKLGVETVTAENGLIAIDQLNNSHRLPDVVLLDIEMPVKDGIQTLREIRKSPRLCHIPVIMVTSRTGAKHRRLAEEAGCNEFMGKPFNFPLLVERINSLTGHELQLN